MGRLDFRIYVAQCDPICNTVHGGVWVNIQTGYRFTINGLLDNWCETVNIYTTNNKYSIDYVAVARIMGYP